mmetsp:Transcript_28968/g.93398  ORF Transcript_28968/g.93398 Transcript_28968/m.93398 type:complete len:464 (+) Transcript_28968:213-1604(+)
MQVPAVIVEDRRSLVDLDAGAVHAAIDVHEDAEPGRSLHRRDRFDEPRELDIRVRRGDSLEAVRPDRRQRVRDQDVGAVAASPRRRLGHHRRFPNGGALELSYPALQEEAHQEVALQRLYVGPPLRRRAAAQIEDLIDVPTDWRSEKHQRRRAQRRPQLPREAVGPYVQRPDPMGHRRHPQSTHLCGHTAQEGKGYSCEMLEIEIPVEVVWQAFLFAATEDLAASRLTCRDALRSCERIAESRISTFARGLAERRRGGSSLVLAWRLARVGPRAFAEASREIWRRLDEADRTSAAKRLREAVRENDPRAVESLVSVGVDVDFRLETYLPPVHAAAFNGYAEALDALLRCGARVDVDVDGNLPLGLASQDGRVASVKVILAHHPDTVNLKNTNGFTPLIAAVVVGELAVCRELVRRGADTNCTTPNGVSALALARRRNYHQIHDILLTRQPPDPDLDQTDAPPR